MPYIVDPSHHSPILITNHHTMLLTKPLTTFLQQNRTPNLHTILLITPTGRLLSSASALPAAELRAQATLASSLWDLYAPLAADGTIEEALPSKSESQDDADLASILIQLELGTMIIRALHCDLLFVAIGVPPAQPGTAVGRLRMGLEHLSVAAASPSSQHDGSLGVDSGVLSSAASDTGSTSTSAGTGSGSLRLLRRQAEELGKWLDVELEGFELSGPL